MPAGESRAASAASSPQRAGGALPGGGGGRHGASAAPMAGMKLPGTHATSPTRPPGAQTRPSSCAAAAWSGAYITPSTEHDGELSVGDRERRCVAHLPVDLGSGDVCPFLGKRE